MMTTMAVSADLVGREVELARLRDALQQATAGQGSVVFLAGEAGIGKSRLAEVIAIDAARRGLRVLRGRAVQGPTPAAYRPLAEALSSAVRAGVVPDAAAVGPFHAILGRLVPQWRVEGQPLDESLVGVAEAVLRFLSVTAADRGALVMIEDLHWADPETLMIIEYLAHNLAAERVLCQVTVRTDEPSPGLDLAWSLHAGRVSQLIELPTLDGPDVAAMVRSCLGTAEVADEVVEFAARAGGVPFLIEELLAAGLTSGALTVEDGTWRVWGSADVVVPSTFSESLRRRVGQLGDDGRAVVVAAAVLGRQFDSSLVPEITDLDQEQVVAALHRAVDAQIVTFDRWDESFRFRHALSRDAVLAELFPPELQTLSRRALQAVEATHPDLEEDWGQVAAELAAAAGDQPRAATLFLGNAREAFDRGALATAEATLDRARSVLSAGDATRPDVDEFLLQVLSFAGKRERAVEVAGSLLAGLRDAPHSAQRRAEIHLLLARAAVAATQWNEADEHLERARRETAVAPDEGLAARVDAVRAQTAIVDDPERAATLAWGALDAAERLGLWDVACEALEVLGRTLRTRDLVAAEDIFARVLVLAEAKGLSLWRARALHELGAIDMLTGRPLVRLEEARELALVHGALATAAVVDVQVAAALVLADDPDAGALAAQRSAELARRYGFDQTVATAVALEAYAHARRRRRTEMQRCIDEAHALAPGVRDVEVKTFTASAMLALVEEDRTAARSHLLAAVRSAAETPSYAVVPATGLLALILQLEGPEDDVPALELPETSVHFLTSAFLRYADAVAAGHAGNAQLAAASMAEADRALADLRWVRTLGRRLVAEAAIADGWGEPVPWLREALDFFDRHGDEHIASACRSLLRKAGSAVPRRRGDMEVPGELRALGVTSREWEVLRLLAEGLSNREIATRLYLSPRTVERHVANLAPKAGVGRRSELVAYAARTLVEGTSRS